MFGGRSRRPTGMLRGRGRGLLGENGSSHRSLGDWSHGCGATGAYCDIGGGWVVDIRARGMSIA